MINEKEDTINGLALCAGVGGLELGVKLLLGDAYRAVGYVEREAYAAATLVARMEDQALDRAPVWDDLKTFDGRPWRGIVDFITAGYPCQPFSNAGQRRGADDPRHLWPDVARIIREIQPAFVFCENVDAHLRLGFDDVALELRAMGYRVAAGTFSAAEMGASHLRKRLFFLAYCDSAGRQQVAGGAPTDEEANGRARRDERESNRDHLVSGISASVADTTLIAEREQDDASGADAREWPRLDTGRGGDSLALAEGGGGQDGEAARERPRRPAGAGGDVGDPDHEGLEGWGGPVLQSAHELPAWPPGPEDTDAWRFVLGGAPLLEPAIRQLADGMANRVDELRASGNGVVPVVAALALAALWRELALDAAVDGDLADDV